MPATGTWRHVVVTGPMGVGKTETATALALRLARPLRDSDTDITRLTGASGAELAARAGIDELHRLESAVLLGALADDRPSIIAAAASVVDDARCREAMVRRAMVVVLHAPSAVVMDRIATGDHRRPIDRGELERLLERRAPLLDEVADLRLTATASTATLVEAVVDRLVDPIGRGPSDRRPGGR